MNGPADRDPGAAANRAAVYRLYQELLNQGAFHRAGEFFQPDVIDHRRLPGRSRGIDNILEGAGLLRAAFPDLAFTVEDLLAGEDIVMARWSMRGTHLGEFMGRAPTGRDVEWRGITAFRLRDGKVVERWLYADDAALRESIRS